MTMCLLPAMAAGVVKPKTALLGMINPAAAVVSAMSGKKKNSSPTGAQSAPAGDATGLASNYGG